MGEKVLDGIDGINRIFGKRLSSRELSAKVSLLEFHQKAG
jgi:hypothetical protein